MKLAPRTDKQALEAGKDFQPKFDADGLIPCICQDAESGEILMFAYMNEASLEETLKSRAAVYYSRSRQKLWKKGETSGNLQHIVDIRTDCDQDVILIRVRADGPACHNGYPSCFYRDVVMPEEEDQPVQLSFGDRKPEFDPAEVYKK